MSIITWTELQTYKGYAAAQETAVTAAIARAQAFIESYTGRKFDVSGDTKRTLNVAELVDGPVLWLDGDLCAITSVVNNADSDTPETLTTADYVTLPRNKTPYYSLRLLASSGKTWNFTNDPENGVEITGKWGYSQTAPDDIKQACMRLAAYYYEIKDSQVFDVTADPNTGQMVIPKGIPQDVKQILDGYRRLI